MTLELDHDVYHLPDSWSKLTPDQALAIAKLIDSRLSVDEFLARLTLLMLQLKFKSKIVKIMGVNHFYLVHNVKIRKYLVTASQFQSITCRLDWVFGRSLMEGTGKVKIESRLTRQLFPEVQVGGEIWYGPADGLSNITFEEFARISASIFAYEKKRDRKSLQVLFASMYRPAPAEVAEFPSDKRKPFNDYAVIAMSKRLDNFDEHIMKVCYLFVSGCFLLLSKRYPKALSGGGESNDDIITSMNRLATALSNNEPAQVEQTRRSQLYDVLESLENIAKQREEIEKMKRRKNV